MAQVKHTCRAAPEFPNLESSAHPQGHFKSIAMPRPMYGLAIEAKSHADEAKISTAMHKLCEEDPTFRVSTKLRAIDPDVLLNGELRPLSTLDPDFAKHRSHYLTSKQGKWPMRVIKNV